MNHELISKTIEVEECAGDCPFNYDCFACQADEDAGDCWGDEPPKNCPLRKGYILVRLKDEQSKTKKKSEDGS